MGSAEAPAEARGPATRPAHRTEDLADVKDGAPEFMVRIGLTGNCLVLTEPMFAALLLLRTLVPEKVSDPFELTETRTRTHVHVRDARCILVRLHPMAQRVCRGDLILESCRQRSRVLYALSCRGLVQRIAKKKEQKPHNKR